MKINSFSQSMKKDFSKIFSIYIITFDRTEYNKTIECSLLDAINYAELNILNNQCNNANIVDKNSRWIDGTIAWTVLDGTDSISWGLG